jgi:tetratricopeptide (TPR) repeat protein
MNNKLIIFTITALFIGFFIGFFFANNINRSAMFQPAAQMNPNAPFNNVQNNAQVFDGSSHSGGMMPEVAKVIETADQEPNNFVAQVRAGIMFLRIQNMEKAGEYFMRASKAHEDTFQDLATLGNAFFDIRNYEEAEKWYTLALTKNPDDVDVRTDLGSTFMERSQPDLERAIKEYKISLEKNPQHEKTLFNLCVAQLRKGDTQTARETYAQLEKINPGNPLLPKLKERLDQNQP